MVVYARKMGEGTRWLEKQGKKETGVVWVSKRGGEGATVEGCKKSCVSRRDTSI